MSKYIDSEKLIAEVERRKELLENGTGHTEVMKRVEGVLKGYNSILDFITSLQQEQPNLPSGEDVMSMCNQILIDWVKEGKTQEEREQREQAHSRFFELYDEHLMQERPEVELEKEIKDYTHSYHSTLKGQQGQCWEFDWEDIAMVMDEVARHFYNLGLNNKK